MANASSTEYQSVVDLVMGFFRETEELSDQNEERLKKLGEISEVAASVGKEGEANETSKVTKCKALIMNICSTLLFGNYTYILTKFADTFSIVKEMENKRKEDESLKLPKAMQERVDAVNDYLENAKRQLKKIDDTLCDLTPKIREARRKRLRVSDEEITDLEMTASDVKRMSDACKKYLDQAENEINLLECDINSEIKSYEMKTAAKVSGVVAAGFLIAGALLSYSEILKLSRKDLIDKLAITTALPLGAAAVTGAVAFSVWWKACPFPKEKYYYELLSIFRNHSRLRQELERDLMNLRCKDIHSNFVF